MSDLLFPIIGAVFVFLVGIPLLTLFAHIVLSVLPERDVTGHGKTWRYLAIVGPTLAPLLWLGSSALHLSESGNIAACLVDHLGLETCRDIAIFGSFLSFVVLLAIGKKALCVARPNETRATAQFQSQLDALCSESKPLDAFRNRIRAASHGHAPIYTRGILKPNIVVEQHILETLDEDEIQAALLHEVAHAQALDPLVYFVAQVALTLNPASRILMAHFARFAFAREAQCDRRAVRLGANPLSLAASIVAVARQRAAPVFTAALGGGQGIGTLRIRVHFLLGYDDDAPGAMPATNPIGLACAAIAASILPHFAGSSALHLLHHSIESTAIFIGLG